MNREDDARIVVELTDGSNRVDAPHIGQLQVHQRDVGRVLSVLRDRFATRRDGIDNGHIGLAVDDHAKALADDAVIIDAQHSNGPDRARLQAVRHVRRRPRGTIASTKVPSRELLTVRLPPARAARSCIPVRP